MLTETLFPVKEVPAIGSPVEIDDKEIDSTGYKFIVREDTGDVLSCMTDEYRLVTNEDLMKTTKPILKSAKSKGALKAFETARKKEDIVFERTLTKFTGQSKKPHFKTFWKKLDKPIKW